MTMNDESRHDTAASPLAQRLVRRGRYFEDFQAGQVIQHPLGRTLSEADNTWFTLLTMNTASAHFDTRYAKDAGHDRLLVNSTLTLAVVVGLSVADLTQNGIVNLGWDDIRLVHPVYVGDTLYAESRIEHSRPSQSRPFAGIVTASTRGLNQNGTTVINYRRSFLVHKRGSTAQPTPFPTPHQDWPTT